MNKIMELAEAMAVAMAGEPDAVALINARAALQAEVEAMAAENERLQERLDRQKENYAALESKATLMRSSLQAELERLQVDAERYQFWRSLFNIDSKINQSVAQVIERATTPEELDAAIDAARSKT